MKYWGKMGEIVIYPSFLNVQNAVARNEDKD